METYQYDINIMAAAEAEADNKMQAIVTLVSYLTAQELTKLAFIVEHDPVKTALAKRYLGMQ
jgi:hypothetical protein